jgi:hypothetical protein
MSEPVETLQVSEIEVIASGLDSPRKLSFSPDGAEPEPVFRLPVNRTHLCSMVQRGRLPASKTE